MIPHTNPHLSIIPTDPKGVLREVIGAEAEELGGVGQLASLGGGWGGERNKAVSVV